MTSLLLLLGLPGIEAKSTSVLVTARMRRNAIRNCETYAWARAYRDRLVLKLEGVDDPNAAEALRGRWLMARRDAVPELPEDRYYVADLVGLDVHDEDGGRVGSVVEVIETAGTDVLVVEDADGHEVLVPMAGEIVTEIRIEEQRIDVRLPDGLRELNRREDER